MNAQSADAQRSDTALDRIIRRLAIGFALAGGAVLAGMVLMSTLSIVGRWLLARPIPGDYELAQLGTAIAVASFLPYCAWRGGHVLVDFLTAGVPVRLRSALDVIGSLSIATIGLLVAWRLAIGLADLRESGETTMVLAIPTWIAYVPMVPSFALLGLVALQRAAMLLRAATGDGASPGRR